jgi:hypothetical protein
VHRGVVGSNENISASKVQPLDSEIKKGVSHDESDRGVAGTDRTLDQARTEPLGVRGKLSSNISLRSFSSFKLDCEIVVHVFYQISERTF